MRTTAALIPTAAAALLSARTPAWPCEQSSLPPLSRRPELEAVSGLVRRHTVREIATEGIGSAPAVVIEVTASSSGTSEGKLVAVVPLRAGLPCEALARDPAEVEVQYPTGAEVTWVTDTASLETGIITLGDGRLGYLARVPGPVPRLQNGRLDFQAFRGSHELDAAPFAADIAWRNAHRRWFEDHELLRSYDTIAREADEEARQRSLTILGFHWRWYEAANDALAERLFRGVLEAHGVRRHDRRQLMARFTSSRR